MADVGSAVGLWSGDTRVGVGEEVGFCAGIARIEGSSGHGRPDSLSALSTNQLSPSPRSLHFHEFHRHPWLRILHTVMSTVKVIYRQKPVFPFFLNTAFLLWGNYELYHIYKGTHPTFSPYLKKAGIYSIDNTDKQDATGDKSQTKTLQPSGLEQDEDGWLRLNGKNLLPSFDMLMRPFRKE
jgi:hypothetical protein